MGNECVIVPGLGGFVAHHVVARYDKDEELFLPPTKTLGFNPQLKMNDSLLAQSYVDAYDMSYPEAVGEIEDEVGELVETLNSVGSYELENLGRLYYDGDGKLNFSPCESGILSPEFYALSSFSQSLLDDKETSVLGGKQADAMPVVAANNDEEEAHSPKVVFIGTENGQKTLNISLKAIRNVAVAAVIMAAVFMVSYPLATGRNGLSTGTVQSGFYEMFNLSHSGGSAKPAVALGSSEHKKATVPAVAKATAKPVARTDVKTQAEEKPWSIVVCSHVSRRNAEELAGLLRGKGFADVRVSTDGAVKVLYGHYATKAEAHKTLNTLVDSEYFKDAWLLEVKQ